MRRISAPHWERPTGASRQRCRGDCGAVRSAGGHLRSGAAACASRCGRRRKEDVAGHMGRSDRFRDTRSPHYGKRWLCLRVWLLSHERNAEGGGPGCQFLDAGDGLPPAKWGHLAHCAWAHLRAVLYGRQPAAGFRPRTEKEIVSTVFNAFPRTSVFGRDLLTSYLGGAIARR